MTNRVTGRASIIEELAFKNEILLAEGKPPLPSIFKRTPTNISQNPEAKPGPVMPRGPNSFSNGIVPLRIFAREYVEQIKQLPSQYIERPKPARRNFFHTCPVLDLAKNSKLIDGQDVTETFIENNLAVTVLCLVRDCMDKVETDFYGQVTVCERLNGSNWGYAIDSIHDDGPTVDIKRKGQSSRYKSLWEYGSEDPAPLGKPWSLGSGATLTPDNSALQQIGLIEFKKPGHVSFLTLNCKTIRYETRIRASKGKKGEEGSEALAGQTAPIHSKVDKISGTSSTNRSPVGDNHPMVVWEKVEREREFAHSVLDKLAARLTPKLYNALIEAATGATLDQIGRDQMMPNLSPTDKRPGTAGKTLVVTALDILLRDKDLKSDLNLRVNLAVAA